MTDKVFLGGGGRGAGRGAGWRRGLADGTGAGPAVPLARVATPQPARPPAAQPADVLRMEWVSEAVELENGAFAGLLNALDLDSGHGQHRLFRASAAGAIAQTLPTGAAGPNLMRLLAGSALPLAAAHGHLALAAAADDRLARRLAALTAIFDGAAPGGIASVALARGFLLALEGDSVLPDGATQFLHLVDLSASGAGGHRVLDCGALALSPLRAVTAIARLGARFLVAVSDPMKGFDAFALDPAVGTFELLLTRGAQRFAVNAMVASVATEAGGEALLLGTAALAGGAGQVGNWGPELIRLQPDGSWDLIIGQPRFTSDGMRFPASGLVPGAGSPLNAAIRAIASDADGLTVIAVQDFSGGPVAGRREALPGLAAYAGAVRLLASADGEEWMALPAALPDGHGGVTALAIGRDRVLVGFESMKTGLAPVMVVPLG